MVAIGEPARIIYTNYRGETAERTITPKRVWYGISDWHPEPQWFLTAFDHDKNADRDFALIDFGHAQPSAARDLGLGEAVREHLKWFERFICDQNELNSSTPRKVAQNAQNAAAELRAALSSPDHADAGKLVERDGLQSAAISNLIEAAKEEAAKAMRKFPQPNYIISKIAEEAGEVVKAAIHCAEGRENPEAVIAEIKQTFAMLFRLLLEGDEVHGLSPLLPSAPASEGAEQ
ncbi:hypothetical protein [Brucella anthropi]|jgi:phosphoribosyl-ATP pyrophosphohydrolase|uniref:hypothetical protein n=1 Tax=Brucella anthropi TaxID=529 RepID=UPI00178C1B3C|nr:hypothetical protein [Brucella anthropi]